MKIRCFIIDDEPYAIEFLSRFIEQTEDLELLGSETNAVIALDKILSREIVPDIIFLDIEMPKINGLDFAARAGHLTNIVMVTGDSSLSLKAYEFGVVDYLLKPVSYTRFESCVNRIRKRILQGDKTDTSTGVKLALRHGLNNTTTYIEPADVIYVEASSNYCIVSTEKSGTIKTLVGITDMEEKLGKGFLRVHRSFIINLSKVNAFFGNTIVLGKDKQIPLSRNYRDAFLKATKGRDR